MAWTKNFTLPTNFNNNNQFDTSSVLTPDMFNVPYQNTLYLKDYLDIVEGKVSNIDKSLYNLGAYDTISGNVITRQTGYVYIDNETLTYFSDNDRPRWLICNLSGEAVIPSVNTELGQIITGNYETKTEENAWNTNSGMSLNTTGDVVIYTTERPSGLLQYKLATPYTEEIIEGQPLITLDQQGSQWLRDEWEKGLNLLNIDDVGSTTTNGITYSIKNGVITLNGTSSSFTTINLSEPLFLNGDYVLSYFNNFETSKANLTLTSDLYWTFYPTNRIIKFSTTNTQTDIITLNIAGGVTFTNAIIKPMLVKGSTAPTTYQPYNQNKHITNNEAEFLKTEHYRSANLTPYNLTSFPLNNTSRHLIAENLPSGTYTLSLNLNAYNGGSEYIVYINDNTVGTYSCGTSATFTSNEYINSIKIYSNDAAATSAKVMLNEGSIALPYQEYEGKIVHLKDLELYGTKPAIANVQCPIDLSKWNDDTLSHSSGSSVLDLYFDYDALGYIYLLPTNSSGSMTKGIVRYTGGDTDAFTWSISAITNNYIELSCAAKFFLDGPASSRGTLKTANYVLEIEDMYGHTFSLPFSVNYKV